MKLNNRLLLSPIGADGAGAGNANQGTNADAGQTGNAGQGADGGQSGNSGNGEGSAGGDSAGDDGQSLFEGSDAGQNQGGTGGADDGSNGQGGDNNQGAQGNANGSGNAAGAAGNVGGGQTTGLSKEDVAEILKAAGVGQAGQGQPATGRVNTPPQLTPEEFAQRFNVYTPPAQLLNDLRSEDSAKQIAAFTALRDGIVKQALTMSGYQMEQLKEQHLSPLQQHVENQQREQARSTFFKSNPELTKFEAIVDATAIKLLASPEYANKSVPDIHKAIAAETKKVLVAAGINLTKPVGGNAGAGGQNTGANRGNNNSNTNTNGSRKMSTLTGGGQQGGGRAGAGGPSGPAGIEVFND